MNNEFSGNFEAFVKPTKTADNKKTIVELTASYNFDEFCKSESFWDQTVRCSIVKEEEQENQEAMQTYAFQVLDLKHNKGSKDVKTYTIVLSKAFKHDEHILLDKFLHQPVVINWVKVQPDIDFEKKGKKKKGAEPF